MNKIILFTGKEDSDKEIIISKVLKDNKYNLYRIKQSTTRTPKQGELVSTIYDFTTTEEFIKKSDAHKVLEQEVFNTTPPTYYYVDADNINLDKHSYVGTTHLSYVNNYIEYYGENRVVPILIKVDDGDIFGIRLALERQKEHPNYHELCSRFLAESQVYEEELSKTPIKETISNDGPIKETIEEVNRILSLHL